MYIDKQLLLSGTQNADNTITAQTVTAAAVGNNTADLRQARDVGAGEDLYGVFQVVAAATGGTSMEFQVIQADDAALTTNITVIGSTGAIPLAKLTAGARFACDPGPRIGSTGQRYLGVRYVPVGAFTAGSYIGAMVVDVQNGLSFYPAGYTVI